MTENALPHVGAGDPATTPLRPDRRGPSADERRPPHALAEPLLDTSAAARLLSVRPSWIYEAVRAGRIPHLKIGRHIRFLRSDLEDWVVSRRVRESAAPRIRRP